MKKFLSVFVFAVGCAAGPRDVLDGSGHDVVREAGAPAAAYAYVARKAPVAIGVAVANGFSDDEVHAVVDRIAVSASECFKKSASLKPGAARITLAVDSGGVAGAPDVTFAPPESAPLGLLCLLAPVRMSTFSPAAADAGERVLTIESAWGQ